MKSLFASTLGVCLASVLGLGIIASPASAAVTDLLSFKLDFATTIGNQKLPAGEYSVRDIYDGGNTSVLEFTSANGHSVNALVREIAVPSGNESAKSSVILKSEGGVYRIDKIWLQGRDYGFQLVSADFH